MSAELNIIDSRLERNATQLAAVQHARVGLSIERDELVSKRRKVETRTREVVERLRLDEQLPPLRITMFEVATRRVEFNTYRPEVD